MSLTRISRILGKDLRIGPRSPIFLWVLVLPILITLVLQLAFGDLFESRPRLGIVDRGSSEVAEAASSLDVLEVTDVGSVELLKEMVEADDLDAGLVLPPGFDEAVRAGDRPPLELYIGGQSLASDRVIVAITTLELIRDLEGESAPVDVEIISFGDDLRPISERLVPFVVMYALLIAGVFLPSFSLADEREKKTLDALVVTPVRLSEVVAAKGILGFGLAIAMALVTLWMNSSFQLSSSLLVVMLVAGLMLVPIGLIFGTVSKDVTGVFTLIKGTGFILLAPTIWYIFPDWPQWIAKIFPTYWVINPVYEVTLNGASLDVVWVELGIALAVIGALLVVVRWLAERLGRKLGAG